MMMAAVRGTRLGFLILSLSISLSADQSLRPTANPIPPLLFGLHIHRLASTTPWPSVEFGTLRLWDAGAAWPNVEPQPGRWDFSNVDRYISAAEQHHVQILMPIALSPVWASSRPDEKSSYGPGNAAPPKNLDDWRNYVRTVATRYRGRVHYYEIWNEPNLRDFFTGSPEQLVTLTREAQQILKQVDPSNRVISPSATGEGGLTWLDNFLAAGGARYVDIIGYHLYVTPNPPEDMVSLTERVWGIMSQHGIRSYELWDTESGWRLANHNTEVKPIGNSGFSSKVLADTDASGYIARAYVLLWASGVSRFYWYAWDNGVMGLTEADGRTIKPPAIAYGQIENWLVGARMTSCGSDNAGTWNCQITRQGGYVGRIMWNPSKSADVPLPGSWGVREVRDLAGNRHGMSGAKSVRISSTPVLLDNAAQ